MISAVPEIGHFALILGLMLAATLGFFPLVGAARGRVGWIRIARPAAQAQAVMIALAWACLATSFVGNDFTVLNVAANSNSHLPLHYRLAATWGSHEGSMLLWVTMLSLWGLVVSLRSRDLPEEMVARVLGIMGLVSFGFLLFVLTTSNPFQRLDPAPADGADLNPLLQDPGMVVHPPMLYMGYVGFSVVFAFALAALLDGRLDATWARWSRPWTTIAWSFLTLGIIIGSWWAYHTLGWGGWWFWDPVENASLMPWLIGTALMHSLAVTEKRGAFKKWTALLAISTFALSLLGTFLVRSGVLTSVHAFATDPRRGIFILVYLAIVIGGSFTLYAARASRVGGGGRFSAVSRESLLMVNNVLLLSLAFSVLLGTLYPLFLDALGLGKISVGPPYFNAVFVPMMVPLVFLIGVGPLARWKEASVVELSTRLRSAFLVSVVAAVVAPFAMGRWQPLASFGLLLAFWVVAATFVALRERGRYGHGVAAKLARQPRGYWGMILAHTGVAVFIVGVALVKAYEVERDVQMRPGDELTMGRDVLRFAGVSERDGPNYIAARGEIRVVHDGGPEATMHPEKRRYAAGGMPMTDAAISSGITGDLYIALGQPAADGAWTFRIYSKPFISWIWAGFVLMAGGGFLAVTDSRYRFRMRRAERAAAESLRATATSESP